MNEINISIIIPVYNVELFITDCIQSVINQSLTKGVECILVDDCGQDKSMEIAEQIIAGYKGDIKFSIIRYEKNKGLSGARNAGLLAASGKYVTFLDSDDFLNHDAISKMYSAAVKFSSDFVIADYDVYNGENAFPKLSLSSGIYKENSVFESFSKSRWYMMAWNKLCNKEFLLKNKLLFKEGIIHEDDLWSFKIALTAKSFFVLNDKTYNYRVRDNSIMNEKEYDYLKHYNSYYEVVSEMLLFTNSSLLNIDEVGNIYDFILTFIERHVFFNKKTKFTENYNMYKGYRSLVRENLNFYKFRGFALPLKSRFKHFHFFLPIIFSFVYTSLLYKSIKIKKIWTA